MKNEGHRKTLKERAVVSTRQSGRDLQWRQSSLAWIASVSGHSDIRGEPIKGHVPQVVQSLCMRLLGFGGKMVVVPFCLGPIFCGDVVRHGRHIPTTGLTLRKGPLNQSHENSFLLWEQNRNAYRLVMGFALARHDGMWRNHTWVLGKADSIIETTIHGQAYFGIVMDEHTCQLILESSSHEGRDDGCDG
jgi:hypothetical protein